MNSNLLQTIQLQQIASNPKNSAWVFASAGSGKTKILTDRVLRLLLEGTAPNKILCLTFTKTAAAEMQERINSELAKWILCDDAELEKRLASLSGKNPDAGELKKARTLFVKILDEESKIKVQTIHAFCQSLIKIFPFEAQVKPNFEVLEESQEKLLLKEAQKEVLKKAANNEELKNLIQKINSKLHEESLSDLVSQLLRKKEKLGLLKENYFGIEGIIAEIFKVFEVSLLDDEIQIFENFLQKIDQEKILDLASVLENSGSSKNADIAFDIKVFFKKPLLENFSIYKSAFFTDKNEARKIYGKAADLTPVMDEQRNLISEISDKLNSIKISNNSALLLRFTNEILENYSQLKRKNAFLDYDDLIAETNRLLSNPEFSNWIKMKMDSSFDHILIDESQDTNHQQWNIIKALSDDFFSGLGASNNPRSIFIVGDEKQSIYSFQGAEPDISSEIFSYFENKLGKNLKKIELNNSFRSTSEILQAVDKVFSEPNRKNAISKISEFQEHKPIREGLGKVEIWPQIRSEKEEKEEKNYDWKLEFLAEKKQRPEEILAEIIATKIQSRIVGNSAKYGDFMILLRNRTNGFLDALVKYFHQNKIPFTSISRIKFDESLIIQDLLAAAKFVLLPQDDLNLACLLKSPIFNISEEELFNICLKKNSDESTIYQALEGTALRQKLDELITKSQQLNSFEFFYFLLHEKNCQRNFLSRFGGEALEILSKFTLSVFDFCNNFSPNLQKFLEFVEKINPEISLSDAEDNRVKITTIHAAKGLQAPIVMIPDTAYNFNQSLNAKEEISWLNDLPVWCGRKADENLVLKNHRKEKLREAKEEYLRLLYVAMTRPEDELYIGGFGNSSDPDSWYEIVKNSLPEKLVREEDFKKLDVTLILPKSDVEFEPQITLRQAQGDVVRVEATSQINPAQIKGRLIHKILEIFGKNHREDKKWLTSLTSKIIAQENFLDEKEKNEISDLALNFLASDEFEKIFSGEVKCEVEIISEGNFGRLDLLVEKEKEILIIDYKSDEIMPDVAPQEYLLQLRNYEKLVKKTFPGKKISCAILWLRSLKLQIL